MPQDESSSNKSVTAKNWIASGQYFTTEDDGHKIFYHREGQGRPLVLLHGFPTWSYDFAEITPLLANDFDMIAMDFLSYGASDKPTDRYNTVGDSADHVEQLLKHLNLEQVNILMHDYGAIVGQELVDRANKGKLSFKINTIHLMNSGIVYSAYRPTILQRLLILPIVGGLIATQITKERSQPKLNAVLGMRKLSDAEFAELWYGMSLKDGQKLAYLQIRYNTERAQHHQRWIDALANFKGPFQILWGLDDPVSGKHVLTPARNILSNAKVVELEGVGHYPQFESPVKVAKAITDFYR